MTAHRHQPRFHPGRFAAAFVALIALFAGLVLGTAGTAHAAAYRYWSYHHLTNGAWTLSQQGIESYTPADGSVEGFRFAVSGESASSRTPRAVVTFEAVCGSTPVASGLKRVGVVLDYGRPADAREGGKPPAPTARCAVVDAKATTARVLAAVAPIRSDRGFLCTIDGYPAGAGCTDTLPAVPEAAAAADTPAAIPAGGSAVPTADTPASPGSSASTSVGSEAATSGGSNAPWVAIILAVAAIAAAALVSLRRRRR
ncbi:MAG TPA: SCO2322 family protein [Dermatophilaceae bacterium]|nr:SCO2322 family protein [Dermatophilaceae bacterium]